jgi:hypothetical protein
MLGQVSIISTIYDMLGQVKPVYDKLGHISPRLDRLGLFRTG